MNEEQGKKKKKMMPPFVAFYDMHAVTFVLPDKWQMCRLRDCSGLFLYPDKTTQSLTGQVISIPNPIYIEKKNIKFGTRTPNLLQSHKLRRKIKFISDFSRLL